MPAKRKPTNVKRLEGVRSDRINDKEPIPAERDVRPPVWLSGAARDTWDRLAPDLIARKVLTAWDVDLFARFCWGEAVSARLMAEIDRDGPLVPGVRGDELVKHKAWAPLRQCLADMRALGARFGLTPADRARLSIEEEHPNTLGPERLLS